MVSPQLRSRRVTVTQWVAQGTVRVDSHKSTSDGKLYDANFRMRMDPPLKLCSLKMLFRFVFLPPLSLDERRASWGVLPLLRPTVARLLCSESPTDLCTWTLQKPLVGCHQETLQRTHTLLAATKSEQSTDTSSLSLFFCCAMTQMRSLMLIVPIWRFPALSRLAG